MFRFFTPFFLGFLTLLLASSGFAKDLGFRYRDGKCVNDKSEEGLNPNHFGQCSDLAGVVLGNFNFTDVDFSGSKMNNVSFGGSTLEGANLTAVNLEGANLSGVDLNGAILDGTRLKGAKLEKAKAGGAEFRNCNADDSNFKEVDARFAIFNKCSFKNVDFQGANFGSAELSDLNFAGTNFKDFDFKKAKLENIDFSGAELARSNWTSAVVERSKFMKANLRRAVFMNSQLKSVDFSESFLNRADFSGSKISDSKFKGAVYSKSTKLPFSAEKAEGFGMIYKAIECLPKSDVEYEEVCYYLDGSGGKCQEGYALAPQSILSDIAPMFVGKDYRTRRSDNCCIWHKEIESERQDWGIDIGTGGCNQEGPLQIAPSMGGANCRDSNNRNPEQLTLCQSVE